MPCCGNDKEAHNGRHVVFKDSCIVSCGILYPEMKHLMDTGFLNPYKILFTPPGLHAKPDELEKHLLKRLAQTQEMCPNHKIIVAYGKKCYVNADEPVKRVDTILQEAQDQEISRLQGDYGYDILTSFDDRQRISGGRESKTLWFTLGWLKSWKTIYQHYFGWDRADANANFPGFYDRIIVLDSLGVADEYMTEHAEEILEIFDWTGLMVEFHPITLDRLKGLLVDALSQGT